MKNRSCQQLQCIKTAAPTPVVFFRTTNETPPQNQTETTRLTLPPAFRQNGRAPRRPGLVFFSKCQERSSGRGTRSSRWRARACARTRTGHQGWRTPASTLRRGPPRNTPRTTQTPTNQDKCKRRTKTGRRSARDERVRVKVGCRVSSYRSQHIGFKKNSVRVWP